MLGLQNLRDGVSKNSTCFPSCKMDLSTPIMPGKVLFYNSHHKHYYCLKQPGCFVSAAVLV